MRNGIYYNVKDFGAIGNGVVKDTASIQDAINSCHKAGGGIVYLSEGRFLTGTLYLKSNVTIEVAGAAVLTASKDISDYGEDTHYNRYLNEKDMDRCLIFAEDSVNIGLTGSGEINGNAEAFPNENSIYRPMMIRFLRCKNIHVSSLRLYNSAAWTTAFLDSEYIWVHGIDIRNEKRYNGDGLDFDGCQHVYISDCYIKGTDDNLCLQAGDKKYPTRDIHITNCEFTSICAAIRIGLKSVGDISGVVIQNCTMTNVWREGIKLECTEGGNISDILISNIAMKNVRRPIFVLLNNRYEPEGLGSSIGVKEIPEIGTMRRIILSNLIIMDDEEMLQVHKRFQDDIMGCPEFSGIRFDAEKSHPIEEVTLSNIHYTFIGGVKMGDIPKDYPEVLDKRSDPKAVVSENYYPDWSRTAFMDIRSVINLILSNLCLKSLKEDEREPVLLENCTVLKKDIIVLK